MNDLLNSLISPFLLSLFVALGIGLIVGMEREFENISGKEHFAGLRGFAIMSILGCVTAFIATNSNSNILLVVSPAIFLFVSVFHYSKLQKGTLGVVTELSLILVFFLGVLSGLQYIKEALAVAVVTSALLTLKNKFRQTISQITQEELFAFIKFIILALLLLPFLPDKNFTPSGIVNPRSIGFIIVIVSSLSFVGYFIIKFFGPTKGILFTAFFGGAFSSTAVTWVFSNRSKENESFSIHYAAGIIIACGVMFVRVMVIAALFNVLVFKYLFVPCAFITASALIYVYTLNKNVKHTNAPAFIQLGNPLGLGKVFLFALQYVGIALFVYYANLYLGHKGLFITGFISGLTDVDAINISMSKLSLTVINPATGAIIIILAALSNTFFKIGICYFRGTRLLFKHVLIGLSITSIMALISILVIVRFNVS